MKKFQGISSLAVFSLIGLLGCGKKCEKQEKTHKTEQHQTAQPAPTTPVAEAPAVALNDEAAHYAFADEQLSDDEFTIFDDEQLLAESELADQAELDDLMLAWDSQDFGEEGTVADATLVSSTPTEIKAAQPVRFVYNYDWLAKGENKKVDAIAKQAREAVAGGMKVVCEGFTDQLGKPAYNAELSQKRANVMKAELVKRGVPAEAIVAVGRGQDNLIVAASSSTKRTERIAELEANRRVEVKFVG